MHNLFVYGTLKRAYGNHTLIEGARFIGEGVSHSDNFVMWGQGFPFISESNHGHAVRGEVFEIDDFMLQQCDRLENHPDWYCRTKRSFLIGDVLRVEAWVYLQPPNKGVRGMLRRPGEDGVLEWHR